MYDKKDYERALQKYQAYIDENPEGNLAVIAQYYMGRCYAALGQPEQAKPLFEKVLKEHPDLVWANFSEAQLKELQAAGEPAAKKAEPAFTPPPRRKKKFLLF